jgi:hypothetical protein
VLALADRVERIRAALNSGRPARLPKLPSTDWLDVVALPGRHGLRPRGDRTVSRVDLGLGLAHYRDEREVLDDGKIAEDEVVGLDLEVLHRWPADVEVSAEGAQLSELLLGRDVPSSGQAGGGEPAKRSCPTVSDGSRGRARVRQDPGCRCARSSRPGRRPARSQAVRGDPRGRPKR